jgi:hypothetical protein
VRVADRSWVLLYVPTADLPATLLSVCSSTKFAKQQLGKNVPAATNTHVTIQEMLDTVFSMLSVLHQILIT